MSERIEAGSTVCLKSQVSPTMTVERVIDRQSPARTIAKVIWAEKGQLFREEIAVEALEPTPRSLSIYD